MKKILMVTLSIGAFLGFYFYNPVINVIDYKEYKHYDEEYIDKYNQKILKSYDEYREFIGNQEVLLNKKDFKNKHYAILFVFNSCNYEYSGIDIDYGDLQYNESIHIQVKVKEIKGHECNNQKIMLVPLLKNKTINQDRIKYSYTNTND